MKKPVSRRFFHALFKHWLSSQAMLVMNALRSNRRRAGKPRQPGVGYAPHQPALGQAALCRHA